MAGTVGRRATTLRTRLVEHAAELTSSEGWSSVTMARLAEVAGVSRQTVYNEVGGKPALAEAMVLHELTLFLVEVDAQFQRTDDVVEAVRGAARAVLEMARVNPLLRAVLSSSHGAESELLPLLTTHSGALLETAAAVIRPHLQRFALGVDAAQTDVGIDMVVRLVLSHVMQPARSPAVTADEIAWIADRVLDPPPSP